MLSKLVDILTGTLVVGFTALLFWMFGSVARDTFFPYKYMACVDSFSQQAFETDRTIVSIDASGTNYTLYRNGWDVTVIPKSPNQVCNLSREYPPHVSTPQAPTTQEPTQPEESYRPSGTSGYSSRGTESNAVDVRGTGTQPSN